jgi:hypothetical protein
VNGLSHVPFAAFVELVATLVTRRDVTCERIERRLLNVKDKPASRIREREYFDTALAGCFFEDLPRDATATSGRLAAARLADGFEPFLQRGHLHQLDAAESIVGAYEHWERTRWPGAAARRRYAHTIWNVFLLRRLQDLSLRIWDGGDRDAPARLRDVQRLLDAVNDAVPDGGLSRDARWLIQLAQGPLTRGLAPYFRVAERIAHSFTGVDAIEIHAAGAKLAGGHLRSQVRHRADELDRSAESPEVLAVTRNSNAMDVALLIWDVIPLLDAYGTARTAAGDTTRLALADAILQALSADPELLLTRLDLLAPCTMVETVFVRHADGGAALTTTGTTHVARLQRYSALVDDLAASLFEDARALDPARTTYSPLAMVYGFCGDLLANMALAPVRGEPAPDIALEDLFAAGGDAPRKASHAGLHLDPAWAQETFARTLASLERRAQNRSRANASGTRSAQIRLLSADDPAPANAQEYCVTSDVTLALGTGATAFPRGQIAVDREEGRFLASADTNGRWFGVSKIVLSERIARGEDAVLKGVPQGVQDILRLTCPVLIRATPQHGPDGTSKQPEPGASA